MLKFFDVLNQDIIITTDSIQIPPSARVASMSANEHQTSLKHLEHFIEFSLKNTFETLWIHP